ncbi:LssY C-terminus [Loktanella salsilacus]|uniref:LssY C-terminus n=1 Tax=Loktanella salsilacus TaxID=195913 RepID=A0A1I4JCJ7_9RHOB|nr:LssY C-terminus [Loktanella salsilacus]
MRSQAAPSGLQIVVGTASFDAGLKWGLTHRIDPIIDVERNLLIEDLLRDGGLQQNGWAQVVTPMMGQNVVGDPFFTDGRAAILSTSPVMGGPVRGTWPIATNTVGEMRAETIDPKPDCFPAYNHATLGKQIVDICRAQREPMIIPDGVGDDLTGVAKAL